MNVDPSGSSAAPDGAGGGDGGEGGGTGGGGVVRPMAMEDSPDSDSSVSHGRVVRGERGAGAAAATSEGFVSGGDGYEGDRGGDVEEEEDSDSSLGDYVDAEDGEDGGSGDDVSMHEDEGDSEEDGEVIALLEGVIERASDMQQHGSGSSSSSSSSPSSSSSSSSAPSPRRRRVIPSAPARDHTYLPGTSHPIYPPELIRQRSHRRRTSSFASAAGADRFNPNRRELAVLELPSGTILFPGSTIPLRLRNPKWVDYLNRCIESQTRDWAANSSGGNNDGVVGMDESQTFGGGGGGAMHHVEEGGSYQQVDRDAVAIGILPTRKNGGGDDEEGGGGRPMVGRIGTVAIVTSVSREESTESGEGNGEGGGAGGAGPNRRRRRQQQIVATALGTCRFRIVSSLSVDDDDEERRANPARYRNSWGDMADRHLFLVDVIEDEELPLPPTSLRRWIHPRHHLAKASPGRGNVDGGDTGDECSYGTAAAARMLSLATPTPAFAWELACPWRLARRIRRAVGSSPTWSGLRSNLPPADGTGAGVMGPTAFSFWMAANLPLAESERIDLLETHCTSKRLTFILCKVEGENDRSICCVQCGSVVSRMGQMVTVPGAEGTAGAYVNEHGFVHQTVTLRSVEPESVLCIGAPQTKDSWFPGYSWTMAYCNACYCHLGWKFLPAEEGDVGGGGGGGNGRRSSRGIRSRLSSWRRRRTTSSSSCDDASQAGRMSEVSGDGGQGQEEDLPLFWGLSAASVAESTSDSDAQRDSRNTSTLRRLIVALAGGGGFNVEYDESADEINVDEVEE